jgi:hypothetical protein
LKLSKEMSQVHTAADLLGWIRYAVGRQPKRERLILALALKRKCQNETDKENVVCPSRQCHRRD